MALVLHSDAFFISPYVLSSFVALTEKKLTFSLKEVSLHAGAHRTAESRARAPIAKVPVLEHDGWFVSESLAIAEYIAETFPFPVHPARLFPEDLRQRAHCRQVMSWVRTDMEALREDRPTTTVFYPSERTKKPLTERGRAAADQLVGVAGAMIGEGKTTLFDAWCIADAELGLMLQRLHANGDALPPRLARYADAQWARPSVRSFVELARPAWVSR